MGQNLVGGGGGEPQMNGMDGILVGEEGQNLEDETEFGWGAFEELKF